MRRVVPFIGEQQIARADTEPERVKRSSGRVIDEVVSAADAESSWDDIVNPASAESNEQQPRQAGVGISRPTTSSKGKGLVKSSIGASAAKKYSSEKPTRNSVFVPSALPAMEWVTMNNGRGLRITVSGSIDHNLRNEWNRLLEETQGSEAGEFEFNLTQTPSLSLTGLGMLLLFKERKGSRRDSIRLCHCTKEVSQLLHWAGMDKYFVVLSDQQHDA